MNHLNSIVLKSAQEAKIPAGQALAVDRIKFSNCITKTLSESPLFKRLDQEICEIPSEKDLEKRNEYWIRYV